MPRSHLTQSGLAWGLFTNGSRVFRVVVFTPSGPAAFDPIELLGAVKMHEVNSLYDIMTMMCVYEE